MTYSTLQRRTPLRAKSGFKSHTSFKRKQSPKNDKKRPSKSHKQANRPKNERSSLSVHLDIVFSLYIRLRDAMPGGMTRCISCRQFFPFEQIQCGHYATRHNMSVRWDEENCNAQCYDCNCNKSGNLDFYTTNLIAKIGQERFDALRIRSNETKKWSREELKEMIAHYTAEVKRLSKEKCINVKI